MNKYLGIPLLVIGVVVLIYGLDSSASFVSSVSKFFSGAPTNKSIMLMSIGGILTFMGAATLFSGSFSK